jgi:hypothetical protein
VPRPISWLPRLHEIRRTVSHSVRSHYNRADLEQLFALQPRAAQKLLSVLPTVTVGTSRLVEREVLSDFLDRVRDADDPSAAVEAQREQKASHGRRRLRSLVQRDEAPIVLSAPPPGLTLRRGRVQVEFRTLEDLASAMYFLARALESDAEAFAEAYEPPFEAELDRSHEDAGLFLELEALEAAARQ